MPQEGITPAAPLEDYLNARQARREAGAHGLPGKDATLVQRTVGLPPVALAAPVLSGAAIDATGKNKRAEGKIRASRCGGWRRGRPTRKCQRTSLAI